MRTFILSCALALGSLSTFAQGYQFTDVVKVPATPVKNQASTGTCWCFATTSFMESELLRMGKGEYISERSYVPFPIRSSSDSINDVVAKHV